MADITSSLAPRGFFQGIGNWFRSIGEAMIAASEASARVDELTRLQSLSDEQLAARGLERDALVHHVFRDIMHL